LVSVNVNVVDDPTVIGDDPNAFVIVGAIPMTSIVATAGVPAGPVSVVVVVAVLSFRPTVVARTPTSKKHWAPAAIVAPVRENVDVEMTSVPLQTSSVAGFVKTRPAGSESLRVTPVRVVEVFGLEMLRWTTVSPPSEIDGTSNDFVTVGGCGISALVGPAGTTTPVAAMDSTMSTRRNRLIAPSLPDMHA
jgi:hypothetical protein